MQDIHDLPPYLRPIQRMKDDSKSEIIKNDPSNVQQYKTHFFALPALNNLKRPEPKFEEIEEYKWLNKIKPSQEQPAQQKITRNDDVLKSKSVPLLQSYGKDFTAEIVAQILQVIMKIRYTEISAMVDKATSIVEAVIRFGIDLTVYLVFVDVFMSYVKSLSDIYGPLLAFIIILLQRRAELEHLVKFPECGYNFIMTKLTRGFQLYTSFSHEPNNSTTSHMAKISTEFFEIKESNILSRKHLRQPPILLNTKVIPKLKPSIIANLSLNALDMHLLGRAKVIGHTEEILRQLGGDQQLMSYPPYCLIPTTTRPSKVRFSPIVRSVPFCPTDLPSEVTLASSYNIPIRRRHVALTNKEAMKRCTFSRTLRS